MADDETPPAAPAPEPPAQAPAPQPGQTAVQQKRELASEYELDETHPAIKALRRANSDAMKWRTKLDDALEAQRIEQMGEAEKAIALAKAAGRAEAEAEILKTRFADKAALAAVNRLADPSLLEDPDVALKLLGLDAPVTDAAVLASAIDALVDAKPYLAADAVRQTAGSAEGGARQPNHPKSLADQIAEAEKAGDVNTAMRLKTAQLMAVPEG